MSRALNIRGPREAGNRAPKTESIGQSGENGVESDGGN